MKVVQEKVDGVSFLIESVDVDVVNAPEEDGLFGEAVETSVGELAAYRKLKELLETVSRDIGGALDSLGQEQTHLSKMELRLSLGFSAKVNAWTIFSSGAESAMSVTLTWDKAIGDESS